MKTIGQLLKEKREERYITTHYLEKSTKIKASFIELIENDDWENLPPFPTVLGFVKSLAKALNVDENTAVAVLKRDYPPKKDNKVVPKPDVKAKVYWGPKMTFGLGVFVALLLFFGYLGFQYYKFTSPPTLTLESPIEGQVVDKKEVTVFGKTDNDVQLLVNNQPVMVADDGRFTVNLEVSENTKEISVIATSRSGKVSEIHRKIEVK